MKRPEQRQSTEHGQGTPAFPEPMCRGLVVAVGSWCECEVRGRKGVEAPALGGYGVWDSSSSTWGGVSFCDQGCIDAAFANWWVMYYLIRLKMIRVP